LGHISVSFNDIESHMIGTGALSCVNRRFISVALSNARESAAFAVWYEKCGVSGA
jgi:hypothetical protein